MWATTSRTAHPAQPDGAFHSSSVQALAAPRASPRARRAVLRHPAGSCRPPPRWCRHPSRFARWARTRARFSSNGVAGVDVELLDGERLVGAARLARRAPSRSSYQPGIARVRPSMRPAVQVLVGARALDDEEGRVVARGGRGPARLGAGRGRRSRSARSGRCAAASRRTGRSARSRSPRTRVAFHRLHGRVDRFDLRQRRHQPVPREHRRRRARGRSCRRGCSCRSRAAR